MTPLGLTDLPEQLVHIGDALDRLVSSRWTITAMPGSLTATRTWPDKSVDTVILLNLETAYGHRRDRSGNTMWTLKGSVDEVIEAVLGLASQRSADAPSSPVPERTEPDL